MKLHEILSLLTEQPKKALKSREELFWTEHHFSEYTTKNMHPGFLWCIGYYILDRFNLEVQKLLMTRFEENIYYTLAKTFQNRDDPAFKDFYNTLANAHIFNAIDSVVTNKIIIEDENTVSYKESINFSSIPDNNKLCSKEPENFKFKYVFNIIALQGFVRLPSWFPEQAAKCVLNPNTIDLSAFNKILKQCTYILLNYPDKPFPILWLLKIDKLNQFNFLYDTNSKIQMNVELSDIIKKYIPRGNIYDCQEELINAGFEEFAQL